MDLAIRALGIFFFFFFFFNTPAPVWLPVFTAAPRPDKISASDLRSLRRSRKRVSHYQKALFAQSLSSVLSGYFCELNSFSLPLCGLLRAVHGDLRQSRNAVSTLLRPLGTGFPLLGVRIKSLRGRPFRTKNVCGGRRKCQGISALQPTRCRELHNWSIKSTPAATVSGQAGPISRQAAQIFFSGARPALRDAR